MIVAIVLLTHSCAPFQVIAQFQDLGFEVQTISSNSLTISADPDAYRQAFGVDVDKTETEGVFFSTDGSLSRGLSLENVPASLTRCIQAIEFEQPIEFGPPDY